MKHKIRWDKDALPSSRKRARDNELARHEKQVRKYRKNSDVIISGNAVIFVINHGSKKGMLVAYYKIDFTLGKGGNTIEKIKATGSV